ncbi:MAG: sugar phosphate isomerase/epimerase [Pirellulaceae bacterium]
MYVAASTECFPDLSLAETVDRLVDLEYTNVEICLDANAETLSPSAIQADLETAVMTCRKTRRLDIVTFDVRTAISEDYDQFAMICKLAKATKVVTLTVQSGELGTPFNEEVERLERLVTIAATEGVRVGLKTQIGRLSEDPDTIMVLCNNVDGLGVTLDPSHYLCGPHTGRSYDKILKFVYHVHLRDTSKTELQVRIGQGEIEYGRLINQLRKVSYNRSLSVDIKPLDDIDHMSEMRKMRLLLESLL